MRTWIALCVIVMLAAGSALAQDEAAAPAAEKPHIDIVFCIDCSGSMGDVIEAAKAKVWAIVNETAKARPSPVLRIGLFGYGNADRTFRKFDLTDDLDEVYKNLMTFKDEGWGDEYVGQIIAKATDEMTWSEGKQTLRLIYVVGNETARQGPVDYTRSAPAAIAENIMVNAIYCGDTDYQQATPTWREIARLADGQYLEISRTGGIVMVDTPFDEELAKLSADLNGTYLAYGVEGDAKAANQVAQDANATSLGKSVLAERAVAKSSSQYTNAGWDLVDASKNEKFNLADLKREQLPEEMREMTEADRAAYLQQKIEQRAKIQGQIQELAQKREAYVREQIEKQGLSEEAALDNAIRSSLRQQAASKGFEFEE